MWIYIYRQMDGWMDKYRYGYVDYVCKIITTIYPGYMVGLHRSDQPLHPYRIEGLCLQHCPHRTSLKFSGNILFILIHNRIPTQWKREKGRRKQRPMNIKYLPQGNSYLVDTDTFRTRKPSLLAIRKTTISCTLCPKCG